MKSKTAKTAHAAERQTRFAALQALTAGVALPGGVEASVQAHQTGLFFVHVQITTQHGERYTFPRLLADVTENESAVGLADGEHELVFRGVRYESVMDAPPEIRAAAEGAFALLVPALRGQLAGPPLTRSQEKRGTIHGQAHQDREDSDFAVATHGRPDLRGVRAAEHHLRPDQNGR